MNQQLLNPNEELEVLLKSYEIADRQLEMRINQRDNLGVQLMVSCGVMITVMSVDNELLRMLCICSLPILSFYFCTQIFSSYRVHDRLVFYIKNILEPCLNSKLDNNVKMWETFCEYDRNVIKQSRIGGRKRQFEIVNVSVPCIAFFVFVLLYFDKSDSIIPFLTLKNILFSIYFLFWIILSIAVNKHNIKNYNELMLDKISKRGYIRKKERIGVAEKAIFLDRDGTIHVDKIETRNVNDLEFFPDTIDSLKRLNQAGYNLVIITNQSGIGKGHYTEKDMKKFNDYLIKTLEKAGVYIRALYYCPHTNSDNCQCKKPKAGMIRRAILELNIDIKESCLIGDQDHDIEAGVNAGIRRNYLITTGIYKTKDQKYHENEKTMKYAKIEKSLKDAVDDILKTNQEK